VLKTHPGHSREWTKVEKRIEEIRRIFRRHFELADDPLPFREKTKRNSDDFGYRAEFRIRCGPSYAT
jgi:hypothetical protein